MPMTTRHEKLFDRKLGLGLIVAALALVTIGIAAMVASSGPSTNPLDEPRVAASPPTPTPTPLPQRGSIEVRGPVGADILIGTTYYGTAPARIDVPAGDYVIGLRYGKRHRVTQHPVHVVAGQTVALR